MKRREWAGAALWLCILGAPLTVGVFLGLQLAGGMLGLLLDKSLADLKVELRGRIEHLGESSGKALETLPGHKTVKTIRPITATSGLEGRGKSFAGSYFQESGYGFNLASDDPVFAKAEFDAHDPLVKSIGRVPNTEFLTLLFNNHRPIDPSAYHHSSLL